MVSLDNKAFLITYIRNCFVTGDDSGVCELLCPRERITENELELILSGKGCVFPPESQGRASPEIPTNFEKVSRRQSAAESRYMQNKLEKEKKSKIKQTFLQLEPAKELTDEEVNDLFPIETVSNKASKLDTEERTQRHKSLLSQLLSESEVETNLFADFAIYDGSSTGPSEENARSMHNFKVFLWDIGTESRDVPVVVKPAWNTTVAQFIGLVAWKYTVENREPSLKEVNLSDYDVYMFEDEDDLNSDFPPLSRGDHIYKYDFSSLAMLRRKKSPEKPAVATTDSNAQVLVKIHLAGGSSAHYFLKTTPLREVLAKTVRRRMLREHDGGYSYRLERNSGQPLNLEETIQEVGTTEFFLLRENSRQVYPADNEPSGTQQKMTEVLESLELQQYKILLKGVINRDVLFSVSGEKLEIEHLSKSPKFFTRHKTTLYPIDSIVECRILSQSSGPRCVFKLVHCSGPRVENPPRDLHSTQFEAPRAVAEAICRQVTNILYFRGANDAVSARAKKGSITGTG